MYVDVSYAAGGASTQWLAESGVLDVFIMLGRAPADVSRQMAALTGGSALPQMFALGYHQCRWNYRDEDGERRGGRGQAVRRASAGSTCLPQLLLPSLLPSAADSAAVCALPAVCSADVAAVDAGFDQYDIPYDVIWLDIEHTGKGRLAHWHCAL